MFAVFFNGSSAFNSLLRAMRYLSLEQIQWVVRRLSFNETFLWDLALALFLTVIVFVVVRLNQVEPNKLAHGFSNPTRGGVILSTMLLPVIFRVCLLPWFAAPQPHIQDEFSHLLVADTLANGRLANPPHPLWRHLDTIYVLQHPAYASIYPIGQGLMLAIGQILSGNPWVGVLLVTALMSGAVCWVLLECLPVAWAACGGILTGFTYGIRWIDSYWGGEFCALGGALLFGALFRLYKARSPEDPSKWMALIGALGWSIVWLIRPFESVFLFLLFWSVIAVSVFRAGSDGKRWLAPILIIVGVQACTGAVTLIHNQAVTGSFTTVPYVLSQQVDGVPQSFIWQAPISPPSQIRFPELGDMYRWQLQHKQQPLLYRAGSIIVTMWDFFATPWYSIPILLAARSKDRLVWASSGIIIAMIIAALCYPFFAPHYMAAVSCLMIFVVVCGFISLWSWKFEGKPLGQYLTVLLMLGGLLKAPLDMVHPEHKENFSSNVANFSSDVVNSRAFITDKLLSAGGRHVVFVRYGPKHNFSSEWVYNPANIDASRIVWCRWTGPTEDAEVIRYYKGRQFWLVDVDGDRAATQFSLYGGHHNYESSLLGPVEHSSLN
jgi:hypothetical protein